MNGWSYGFCRRLVIADFYKQANDGVGQCPE